MKTTFFKNILVCCSLFLIYSCTTEIEESPLTGNVENKSHMDASNNLELNALNTGVTKMRMIVPAYFYTDQALWEQMNVQASRYPNMIYAIINSVNGPGYYFDSTYLSRISSFRQAGGKILVYVNTYDYPTFTPIPEAKVKADVDQWYAWYGPEIDGVFYDQMYPATGGQETFYRNLYKHVKYKDPAGIIVGNPGGHTSPSYLESNGRRLTDVICTFENVHTLIPNWPFQPWQQSFSYQRFYFLPHSAPSVSDMYHALNEAVARDYGWFYCTNDVMPNPWDKLPSYFTEMCAAVKAVASGRLPNIAVDGNPAEWNSILPLVTDTTSVQSLKIVNNASTLFLLIEGNDLNTYSNVYLNTDNDVTTGYHASGWAMPNGCDYMIENNMLYIHNGEGWSWSPVATLLASQFVKTNTAIEVGIPLSALSIARGTRISAGYIKNISEDRLPRLGSSMAFKAIR